MLHLQSAQIWLFSAVQLERRLLKGRLLMNLSGNTPMLLLLLASVYLITSWHLHGPGSSFSATIQTMDDGLHYPFIAPLPTRKRPVELSNS